jgi:hypothetical protein
MKKKKSKAKKKLKPRKKAAAKAKIKAKPKKKYKAKAKSAKKKKAQKSPPKPGVIAPANGVLLGYVEDYFAKIGVVALTLQRELAIGNHIHILGHTTNLEQTVDSMQIEHQPVTVAKSKDAVGIKVTARTRRGDHVYLIP